MRILVRIYVQGHRLGWPLAWQAAMVWRSEQTTWALDSWIRALRRGGRRAFGRGSRPAPISLHVKSESHSTHESPSPPRQWRPRRAVGGEMLDRRLAAVQREPDLLRAMKRAMDRNRRAGRFPLTGSAKLLLMRQVPTQS